MPFKPGTSGNPRGRPRKGRTLVDLLRSTGNQKNADGITRKRAFALALWAEAADGNVLAMRLILEYLVGKALPIAQSQAELDKFVKRYVSVDPDDWPD